MSEIQHADGRRNLGRELRHSHRLLSAEVDDLEAEAAAIDALPQGKLRDRRLILLRHRQEDISRRQKQLEHATQVAETRANG